MMTSSEISETVYARSPSIGSLTTIVDFFDGVISGLRDVEINEDRLQSLKEGL